MREFSKVSPSLWNSRKFQTLSDKERLLYLYILTNPHNNSCGCYRLPLQYIMADLKWSEKDVKNGVDTLCHTVLIRYDYDENFVKIENHFAFNVPQNPKHALKVFRELETLPNSEIKLLTAKEYNAIANGKDGWNEYPIDTVYHTVCDTVSALDRDKTETKTETAKEKFIKSDLSELNEWFSINAPSVNKEKLRQKILDWCSSKGKTYKDYFAAMRTWAAKEHEENLKKGWIKPRAVNLNDPFADVMGGN